jgi:hypothetical protein
MAVKMHVDCQGEMRVNSRTNTCKLTGEEQVIGQSGFRVAASEFTSDDVCRMETRIILSPAIAQLLSFGKVKALRKEIESVTSGAVGSRRLCG